MVIYWSDATWREGSFVCTQYNRSWKT